MGSVETGYVVRSPHVECAPKTKWCFFFSSFPKKKKKLGEVRLFLFLSLSFGPLLLPLVDSEFGVLVAELVLCDDLLHLTFAADEPSLHLQLALLLQ